MNSRPRILFFGYSEVGFDCLSLLVERGDRVVALFTHEANPAEKIWFRAPAAVAQAHGIPVHTPEKVNTPEWEERIARLAPDLILSAYYRHLISPRILALARLGAFNLHGSLLPRYRGRAPINWAVLNGEPWVGMTLHRMVQKADAGAVVDQAAVALGPRDTAAEAFRKVLPCARQILARQIDALLAGTAREVVQDESQASYFGARGPEQGRVNWAGSSRQIFNLVRAVADPFPGAFTEIAGSRLMLWWAEPLESFPSGQPGEILSVHPLIVATGDGALELTKTEWRGPAIPLARGQKFPS